MAYILRSNTYSYTAVRGDRTTRIGLPQSKLLNTEPLSPENISRVCDWANECLIKHAKCKQEQEHRFALQIPSRLIEVRSLDDSTVHLVDTNILRARSKSPITYMALSYCWGNQRTSPNKKLTTENTERTIEKGLTLDELPATVRDAIIVARSLGLSYLWVDAICIVQDCEADKDRELPKMADIYARADIVLVAAGGSHCNMGLSKPRDVGSAYGTIYNLPFRNNGSVMEGNAFFLFEGSLKDEIDSQPIDQRAWTFQEGAQALRTLKFGQKQTRWICQQSNCEQIDGGSDTSVVSGDQIDGQDFTGKFFQNELTKGMECPHILEPFHDDWRMVVERYMKRSIECVKDRLPAFAAIAQNFYRTTGNRAGVYRAGLWENDMLRDLVWYKLTPGKEPQGPSWSWSSSTGPVKYPDKLSLFKLSNVTVLEYNIRLYQEKFRFGRVLEGTLTIRAHITRVHYDGNNFALIRTPDPRLLPVEVKWDTLTTLTSFFFIQLIQPWVDDKNRSEYEYYGIVLTRIQDNLFKRVGWYSFRHPYDDFSLQNTFTAAGLDCDIHII